MFSTRLRVCLVALIGLALLIMLIFLLYLQDWLHREMVLVVVNDPPPLFEVERGDSIGRALSRYESRFGLRHRKLLTFYARVTGLTRIKQGEYQFPSHLTPLGLLQLLNDGRVFQRPLTLVEGSTAVQALQMLQAQTLLQHTLQSDETPASIATRLGIENGQLEGWLFPDTYYYVKGSSDWDILQRAYRRMQEILTEEWQQRAMGLPYETPYEALILASIIEKETAVADERGQIAGVFVRRLQQGMRLQTDPTVIYGLGSAFDGNIRRKHLRQSTPYNTYVIRGLPPTPIALPGREAIHAALQPTPGDSLYFVARGDGTHVFSATLAEHERAVNQHQRNR